MSTIRQVDPIALRQKLQKLGIGPGAGVDPGLSETFAEDAVKECLRYGHVPEPPGIYELPGNCPTLRLEPAELAYCLHSWSQLWEAPA